MTRIRSLFQWLFLLSAVAISVLLAGPAWAAYVIYVQGTNNLLPGTPNVPVSTIFNGSFSDPANFADGLTVQNVSYPATLGLLNVLSYHGPGLPPTLNQSVAIGVANLDAIIKADQLADPTAQIYVIGYSEGAIVGTQEALALQGQPAATYQNITFILAGNLERAAPSGGGILTQIPIRITIPGVATVGGGVLSAPTPTNGPKIIDVTNQGDPAANFDLAHPLAIVSGGLKTSLLLLTGIPIGPHNYTNTVLTPAMVTSGTYAPGDVVTTTGNLTDVFIPSTTPSPAPHLPVQLAQPVQRLRPVSSTVQSSAFSLKPVATQQATQQVTTPVATQQATQQVTTPVATQQATQQVTTPVATQQATKPTHTEQHLAGHGGK
jgi:hypothetical protein